MTSFLCIDKYNILDLGTTKKITSQLSTMNFAYLSLSVDIFLPTSSPGDLESQG